MAPNAKVVRKGSRLFGRLEDLVKVFYFYLLYLINLFIWGQGFVETRFLYVAQEGLEFLTLLPQPPEC